MKKIFGFEVPRIALIPDGSSGGGVAALPNSNNAEACFSWGNTYLDKRDYDRAITNYSHAIRLNPNFADAYNNRGLAYFYKRDYDKAITDFSETIRLNSNYVVAYYNRGNAYLNKRDYDKAITDFSETIRLNPNYADAYNSRGYTYFNKKDYDRAITDYSEAIRLDPNLAIAYYNRGSAYFDKRDYDKAIANYSEVIRLDPNLAVAYHNRGVAYFDKRDYDKAIADYSEVIRLNPNDAVAYNNRGLAYKSKEDFARARADWEKALSIDPANADARKYLKALRKGPIAAFGRLLMKSNIIFLAAAVSVLAVAYFFIDAFTPNITEIDTVGSLGIENSARFYVTGSLKVKSMDGLSVEWKPKFTADAILVLLPPGAHAFTLDFEASDGDTKWSAKDLKTEREFNSGKYYRFNYTLDKETNRISYSINETDPVVYKSEGFDPTRYGSLIAAAIAVAIAVIFTIIARKTGVVFNLTPDD
jgi:tetratricopeptide (TPR) repeat protein